MMKMKRFLAIVLCAVLFVCALPVSSLALSDEFIWADLFYSEEINAINPYYAVDTSYSTRFDADYVKSNNSLKRISEMDYDDDGKVVFEYSAEFNGDVTTMKVKDYYYPDEPDESEYVYNAVRSGNKVTESITEDGKEVGSAELTFDENNRVKELVDDDDSDLIVEYTDNGKVSKIYNAKYRVEYTYDAQNRLSSGVSVIIATGEEFDKFSITYNDSNHMALYTDNRSNDKLYFDEQGRVIKYENIDDEGDLTYYSINYYDSKGRLSRVVDFDDTGVKSYELIYEYEAEPAPAPAPTVPATGDSSNVALYAVLAIVALAGAMLVLKRRRV